MNTQVDVTKNPAKPQAPYLEVLAELLIDETWGLARAAQSPALQEICFGLGDHYQALAKGKASPRGLQGLLPLLLKECREELKQMQARPMDYRVLLAARIIWAAPALGLRGLQAARKAWLRVWRRQAGAAVRLQSLTF